MFLRLSFVTLIFAVAALGTPVKRDAITVESDIQNLQTQAMRLDATINAFPDSGATIQQAFSIHEEVVQFDNRLKTTTQDATASASFTEQEASAVFGEVASNVQLVEKSLKDLEGKKNAITAIHAGSIVASDLKLLQTDADALGKVLVDKSPADMKSDGQNLFKQIDAALRSAMDAYA